MQVLVIYEDDGSIVGLGPARPDWPDGKTLTPPRPIDGQTIAQLDMPDEYTKLSHAEIYDTLRVNLESDPHTVVAVA
jgi:hypothetical protein